MLADLVGERNGCWRDRPPIGVGEHVPRPRKRTRLSEIEGLTVSKPA
jgi:hypothetical protein